MTYPHGIARRPITWIIFALACAATLFFATRYFSRAFPVVNLSITMDRGQALELARELSSQFHLGPQDHQQAASFNTDQTAKLYVELEAGGTNAFNAMLCEHLYYPYTWQVRQFKEGETNEVSLMFTPDGNPYGFVEKIAEQAEGAALSSAQAQKIAERDALPWNINFDDYKRIETSQEEKPSKRIDHTFVYERPQTIGQAFYRLRLTVSGDKLTEVSHYVKVPQEFELKYQEMRSANNTIAVYANYAMLLLYILGCCLIGLTILMRTRWLTWKMALLWGCIIALANFIALLNQLPFYWMFYHTALGTHQFLIQIIIRGCISFVAHAFGYALIFMAAEGLTRMAFGQQPQFWLLWSKEARGTIQLLGRTITGYFMVVINLALVVATYLFATRYLGWWVPADTLIDPNVLATYFPWFNPLALSLQAGFLEECLFRALPLASAALLGKKFGGKNYWIFGAFVLQILIFGAAHANYPAQPAYARVVELIIPSAIFGGLYLLWGLLPAIICHVVFDIFWFSLPLFVSQAPGAFANQMMVIVLSLIPLIVVIFGRLYSKQWHNLANKYYNSAWQPEEVTHVEAPAARSKEPIKLSRSMRWLMIIVGIAGLALMPKKLQRDDTPLITTADEAVTTAREHLTKQGITIPEHWQTLPMLVGGYQESPQYSQHKFVWQEWGNEAYKHFMGTYLQPARWIVRFVTFTGSTTERAEEYMVAITDHNNVVRTVHVIPEATPGANLTVDQARKIAHGELQKTYGLQAADVQEKAAQNTKHPARTDWEFEFFNLQDEFKKEDAAPSEGQPRIAIDISGDKVTDSYRYIFVPEQWERAQTKQQTTRSLITTVCWFLFILCLLLLARGQQLHGVSVSLVAIFIGVLFALNILNGFNGWSQVVAQFNTSEPYTNQLLVALGGMILWTLVMAFLYGVLIISTTKGNINTSATHESATIGRIIALLLAGIYVAVSFIAPRTLPVWGSYAQLGFYMPFIATLISSTVFYLVITSLVLYMFTGFEALEHRYKRGQFLIFGVIFLACLTALTRTGMESILFWLIGGIATSMMVWLLYYYLIRFDTATVPHITVLPFCLYLLLQSTATRLNGGWSVEGIVFTILFLGFVAGAWNLVLRGKKITWKGLIYG